jgi:hypothetical protein
MKKIFSIVGCFLVSSAYTKIPSYVGDLVARDLSGAGPLGQHISPYPRKYYSKF